MWYSRNTERGLLNNFLQCFLSTFYAYVFLFTWRLKNVTNNRLVLLWLSQKAKKPAIKVRKLIRIRYKFRCSRRCCVRVYVCVLLKINKTTHIFQTIKCFISKFQCTCANKWVLCSLRCTFISAVLDFFWWKVVKHHISVLYVRMFHSDGIKNFDENLNLPT